MANMTQQLIGGKYYDLGTPEWQAAMNADKIARAGIAGTAAGTAIKNANTAAGGSQGPVQVYSGGGFQAPGPALPPVVGGGASGGGATGGATPPVGLSPEQQAAQTGILNRAKERAGQIARSSLTGLRSAMGERGALGSGLESSATGEVASRAASDIANTNTSLANNEANQAFQQGQFNTTAALNQRGQDVSMRGQDIGLQQAREGLGQNQQQLMQQAILAALRGMSY